MRRESRHSREICRRVPGSEPPGGRKKKQNQYEEKEKEGEEHEHVRDERDSAGSTIPVPAGTRIIGP
jgi:hypothetical protein